MAGLAISKGGQIKINAWDTTDEVMYVTPKTVLVNIVGAKIKVKRMGEKRISTLKEVEDQGLEDQEDSNLEEWKEKIQDHITKEYRKVGDLSSHPGNKRM